MCLAMFHFEASRASIRSIRGYYTTGYICDLVKSVVLVKNVDRPEGRGIHR